LSDKRKSNATDATPNAPTRKVQIEASKLSGKRLAPKDKTKVAGR
jgi:hypothetical protein